MKGVLYIVATPIGNPADLSDRAKDVLRSVDVIAVEDTRNSGRLLSSLGIQTPMLSFHDHNEVQRTDALLKRVQDGKDVALISDAGTPLISDPGFQLVREAHEQGLRVVPVPGPSSVMAALCCSGLPTDKFVFEGFLPAKANARQQRLQALANEQRTLIFFEAPHRIHECIRDMVESFGANRVATLARELTKIYETVVHSTLGELETLINRDENQRKGEIVLVVAGAAPVNRELSEESEMTLRVLLEELPLKQAAALAARLTGVKKNALYEMALAWKQEKE